MVIAPRDVYKKIRGKPLCGTEARCYKFRLVVEIGTWVLLNRLCVGISAAGDLLLCIGIRLLALHDSIMRTPPLVFDIASANGH